MIEQLLRESSLEELLSLRERGAELVAFGATATAGAALARLATEQVRSAPVLACETHGIPTSCCGNVLARDFPLSAVLGFVDTAAAVDLLLHALPHGCWPPSPDDLEAAGAEMCARPVTALLRGPSRRHKDAAAAGEPDVRGTGAPEAGPWPCVGMDDSVEAVVGVFAATHVQHLCVRAPGSGGADPRVVSVVSQSDIIKFLASHLNSAGELAGHSLAALGLAGRALAGCARASGAGAHGHSSLARSTGGVYAPSSAGAAPVSPAAAASPAPQQGPGRGVGWKLATVPETASALDAFRCLHARGVSGVAITGGRGDLVGHMGASDARVLSKRGAFSQLLLPVREFLGLHPRAVSGGGAGALVMGADAAAAAAAAPCGAPLPLEGRVLCAQPTSSLAHVLATLARQRVHRVYVADSDCKPVGLVTCTDALAALSACC